MSKSKTELITTIAPNRNWHARAEAVVTVLIYASAGAKAAGAESASDRQIADTLHAVDSETLTAIVDIGEYDPDEPREPFVEVDDGKLIDQIRNLAIRILAGRARG